MTAMSIFGVRHRPESPISGRWPSLLGIELELEGINFNGDMLHKDGSLWDTHDDASLRRGIEFVTCMPIRDTQISTALDQYFEMVEDFTAGPRTSTHVHVNVSDVDSDVVRSMFFLMYFLEEGVYATTEESRKWAGYSMPLREMRSSRIRNILNPLNDAAWQDACIGGSNAERYYGFNTNWSRHGTVEFRYFPGGPDRGELEHWLDLPTAVKQVAKNYTVEQLVDMFHSAEELSAFISENFGDWGKDIVSSTSPSAIYQYYQDVASLASDGQEYVRSNVYFISPRLRSYIENKILKADPPSIVTFNKLMTTDVVSEDTLSNIMALSIGSSVPRQASPYDNVYAEPDEPYYPEGEEETEEAEEPDPPRSVSNLSYDDLMQMAANITGRSAAGPGPLHRSVTSQPLFDPDTYTTFSGVTQRANALRTNYTTPSGDDN